MVEELRQLKPFDPEHLPEETQLTEAFHSRCADFLYRQTQDLRAAEAVVLSCYQLRTKEN